MCDLQLQMVSRTESNNFHNMHHDRPYIQRSRKHQLPGAENVAYILTCNQCEKQYIGETGTPFIERWKEYLYDIKVKRPYPVARHFNENDDHKKATFHAKILSLINGTAERATQRRKYKESRWIRTFKSFQPEGINLRE